MYYIGVFYPAIEKDGGYVVTFPDLPGCVTQGNSFEEALINAHEVLEGFLDLLQKDGDTLPTTSNFIEIKNKVELETVEESEPLSKETLFQAILIHR